MTCGDIDENSGPHCSGCSLKNCVSCIDTRIHLDHLTGKILKIQWVSFPSNNRTSAVKTQDGLKSILPSVPSKCSHRDTRHWHGFRTASQ